MPILIVQGDHDFVRLEHSVETVKLIPHAELAVIPDASHFALSVGTGEGDPNCVKHFLGKPEKQLPLATANVGYHPSVNIKPRTASWQR